MPLLEDFRHFHSCVLHDNSRASHLHHLVALQCLVSCDACCSSVVLLAPKSVHELPRRQGSLCFKSAHKISAGISQSPIRATRPVYHILLCFIVAKKMWRRIAPVRIVEKVLLVFSDVNPIRSKYFLRASVLENPHLVFLV